MSINANPELLVGRFARQYGLNPQFPLLRQLTGDDLEEGHKLFIPRPSRWLHKRTVVFDELLDLLPNTVAVVTFRQGQGVTTLSRYVTHQSEDKMAQMRTIPVRLTVGDLNPADSSTSLGEQIHIRILKALVNFPRWDTPGVIEHYAQMIGTRIQVKMVEDPKSGTRASDIDYGIVFRQREALQKTLEEADGVPNWEKLAELAPTLGSSFIQSADHFSRYGYYLGFQVDLSSSILRTNEALYYKNVAELHEWVLGLAYELNSSRRLPFVRQLYFAPREAVATLQLRDGRLDTWEYPPYSYKDVAEMIKLRYPYWENLPANYRTLITSMPDSELSGTIEQAVRELIYSLAETIERDGI